MCEIPGFFSGVPGSEKGTGVYHCRRVLHACRNANVRKWVDCVEKPGAEIGAGASLSGALKLRPRLCGGWGGWHGDQLGHFAEVLGGGGEEELVSCAIWTSQAQAIHS